MELRLPRVRSLDPSWIDQNGEQILILRDRTGLIAEPLGVQPIVGLILSLCDGLHTLEQIRLRLETETKQIMSMDEIFSMIGQLEEALILEGPAVDRARTLALDAYHAAPARAASLAGGVYPAEPGELRRTLADYGRGDKEMASRFDADVRGIVSPHIDYQRGGKIYHRVWTRAQPALRAADVLVIFGTDHIGGAGAITLTRQSYDTPFGLLETDQRVIDAIAAAIGETAAFSEELHHIGEHSIELAVVWAASMLGERRPTVVPILCGSFHEYTNTDREPAGEAAFEKTLRAIEDSTAGRRVIVIAAADLAHVGPEFGDPDPIDEQRAERLRSEDEILLRTVVEGRSGAFVDELRRERDARKVCGLPPIYLTMRLLGADMRGEVVGYDQYPAGNDGGSRVSIAGALLW